jgi:hypothetical protein
LAALVWVSTQAPPQATCGEVHDVWQLPAAQTWPVPQAWPQLPQLAASVWVLVQAAPQTTCGEAQTSWQLPATQAWVALQAWPQLPQLVASVWVLTQAPLQLTCGAVQGSTGVLPPPPQPAPAAATMARRQAAPQARRAVFGFGVRPTCACVAYVMAPSRLAVGRHP